MEPCGPADEAPRGKHWVAIDGLLESAFRDVCDFQAVRQAIAQVMVRSEDTAREPFGRLGWYPGYSGGCKSKSERRGFI